MNYFVSASGGYELVAPDGDRSARPLPHGGPCDEPVLQLAAALAQQGLVVDVGARIGNRTVFLGRSGCDVIAIETDPAARRYLEGNVRRNGLVERVRVVSHGVGIHEATRQVIDPVALNSLGLAPAVIHVDASAEAYEVLSGSRAVLVQSQPAIFVTTDDADVEQLSGFLGDLGYRRASMSFGDSPTLLFLARPEHRRIAAPFVAAQRRRLRGNAWKSAVKRVPVVATFLPRVKTLAGDAVHAIGEAAAIRRLRAAMRMPGRVDAASNVVVSLTSFPARIDHVWIAIESLLQQDMPPRGVVLVLAESEFPDRKLPGELRRQEERGLEILWTDRNTRSYKKLLPTREAYPQATIVTVDDDVLYDPRMLSGLCAAARQCPHAIVGQTGSIVTAGRRILLPYRQWPRADRSTPVHRVLLTGNGGILYPPHVLPAELLADYALAERLCPAGDDIWFWAVARQAGVPVLCLGNHALHMLRYQHATPQLATLNWAQDYNDVQLRNVFEHFGFFDTLVDDEP